jgi:hypothetical protein
VLGSGGIGPKRDVDDSSTGRGALSEDAVAVIGGGGGGGGCVSSLDDAEVDGCKGGSTVRFVIELRRADTERVDVLAEVNTPSGRVASPTPEMPSTELSSSTWSLAK